MDLMLSRIYRQSWILLAVAAVAALIFADMLFAFSVILSGALAIFNFRGIVWGVKSLVGTEKSQAKMMILTMFRMLIMFSVLLILFILKLVNLYGILIGFTIVFVIIVKEGLIASRKKQQEEAADSCSRFDE